METPQQVRLLVRIKEAVPSRHLLLLHGTVDLVQQRRVYLLNILIAVYLDQLMLFLIEIE
jgi:hypothetical protein